MLHTPRTAISHAPSSASPEARFTFGIEEEYFVIDARNKHLVVRARQRFIDECKEALGGIVATELLQSQIEIATPVLEDIAEAGQEMRQARGTIAAIAEKHGLNIVAAGTYPLATWAEQQITPKRRYKAIRDELQMVGRRNVLCGTHIHVAPPENASRVDLMNRALPFLPLILALSTSSPFWQKHRTGMKGYRLAAYDELPRTGLPAIFRNDGEYQLLVDMLVNSGAVPHASHIWWAIRPSAKFHTLELRIADSCTLVADTLCVTSLFRCLVRALWRDPKVNAEIQPMHRLIVDENRWRAQRFGIHGSMIDLATGKLRPMTEAIEEMLALIAPDAEELNCRAEVDHVRRILDRGTSADIQLDIYSKAREAGLARQKALLSVSNWLVSASRETGDDTHAPSVTQPPTTVANAAS